jgi:ATP-dependent DNA ligase
MLARLARHLPEGPGLVYEPKWDGFRCLAFRSGDEVDLRSRNDRPFARYFPEVVAGLLALGEARLVLDGELLACRDGRADFDALMARLHPSATWVARRSAETPAVLVAFDLLAAGRDDLRDRPFAERRARLEAALAGDRGCVLLTPATSDPAEAAAWLATEDPGIDGVVVKDGASPYRPGVRAMVKVKPERTADCVVAGVRLREDGVGSLLLGLHGEDGTLHHVGVVASFRRPQRRELLARFAPLAVALADHPWRDGFGLEGGRLGRMKGAPGRWTPDLAQDWLPVRPAEVCEVAFDKVEGLRFRHPARFRRWRPDRDPASCTVDQLRPAP